MTNNDYLLVGFVGLARSGKTTAASHFCKFFSDDDRVSSVIVYQTSFAKPIRDALRIMGVEKDENPVLYRELAQYLGTEVFRQYNENWWVNQLVSNVEAKISTNNKKKTVFLIDDVRFQNEIDMIRSKGGVLVWVDPKTRINLSLPMYSHSSEALAVDYFLHRKTALLDFDYVLNNHTDEQAYVQACRNLFETMISDKGLYDF